MSGRESTWSVKSPGEAFVYTEIDPSGYGLRRARAWQTVPVPSGGPWAIGRPASSHACPASKDTHARPSAKHHARASMPQAKCSHSQAIKQKGQCMQRIWQNNHCATRGRACTRQPAPPYDARAASAHRRVRARGASPVVRGPTWCCRRDVRSRRSSGSSQVGGRSPSAPSPTPRVPPLSTPRVRVL
jgi:hypothetical protein